MKIKIRKKYLKRSQKGKSPARFHAVQPRGENTTVHALIVLDPVLRKHVDLRKPIVKHEVNEIQHWGEGNHCHHAHIHAKSKEPKLTRNMSVDGFWQEIEKRKKKSQK
jgi:hypothetical protein